MIGELERAAGSAPDEACFWFVDAHAGEGGGAQGCAGEGRCAGESAGEGGGDGADSGADAAEREGVAAQRFSFADVRLLAAAVARLLLDRGVARGATVAVDAANCAAYPILLAAAGYGGFSLLTLNNRLSEGEKRERIESLAASDVRVAASFDGAGLAVLLDETRAALAAAGGRERAAGDAERFAAQFDEGAAAVIMFTSGSTGTPKAVPLTWANLVGSARAANEALGGDAPDALWQAALPLYHVGGLQIVVRSVLANRPFALYERFDAVRMIADAQAFGATHVSVVDKMLRDLTDAADQGGSYDALAAYRCILLGGAAPNAALLKRAAAHGLRVFASYGMTETSSAIAAALVRKDGMQPPLALLPGYKARVHADVANDRGVRDVAPGEQGALTVSGPGVFSGYAKAEARFAGDGFFVTGDTAAIADGRIVVGERTADMFVSGGENVYPARIRESVLDVPGVADAYVYGAADDVWGRRPVALIERDSTAAGASPHLAAHVRAHLEGAHSRISRPDRVIALPAFPRTGIGKTDRRALEAADVHRIDIARVALHRVTLPFLTPFTTATCTLDRREVLLVQLTDYAGRTGVGESASFATDWYLPETIAEDECIIREVIAPYLRAEAFARPEDVYASLAALPEAAPYPHARAAVEMAAWDLYGKIVQEPLWRLIGGESACEKDAAAPRMPVGAAVGIASVSDTLARVDALVTAGYRRVKLKVAPGAASIDRVRAVRAAHPNLALSLDANQSFHADDPSHMADLRALDTLGAAWIEEPLAFEGGTASKRDSRAAHDRFARLDDLQQRLATPLCLDESFVTIEDARAALAFPRLRCFATKIGKFGGIAGALAFVHEAQVAGARVWMGGMYDTGVSRRAHAAFEALPGIDDPGDLSAPAGYFGSDAAVPAFEPSDGFVTLNDKAHPYGLGCDLA